MVCSNHYQEDKASDVSSTIEQRELENACRSNQSEKRLTADPAAADYSNDEDNEIQESQSEQAVECNLPAADASPIEMLTEESNSRSPVV